MWSRKLYLGNLFTVSVKYKMRIAVNGFLLRVDPETKNVILATAGTAGTAGTEFVFMDMNDNITETIEPNIKYVFGTIFANTEGKKFLVMHMTPDGVLKMVNEREVNTLNRVYFVAPLESPGNSGYSRFIYSGNERQLVWSGSNDIVLLEGIDEAMVECSRDCEGKKCGDSDGCGSICGCGVGNTCMPDGTCEVQQPNQQAAFCVTANSDEIGTCAGRCFGSCSAGATCTQNNGVFSCKMSIWSTTFVWILIAIAIFIVLLLLGIK